MFPSLVLSVILVHKTMIQLAQTGSSRCFDTGDLWSGGEGGVIKIWPWDTIGKSLSLSSEEKHMAALLVERSHIDLRGQVTVNGACGISSSDVKCLVSDHVKAKVWCAQPLYFSLWYVFASGITCRKVYILHLIEFGLLEIFAIVFLSFLGITSLQGCSYKGASEGIQYRGSN